MRVLHSEIRGVHDHMDRFARNKDINLGHLFLCYIIEYEQCEEMSNKDNSKITKTFLISWVRTGRRNKHSRPRPSMLTGRELWDHTGEMTDDTDWAGLSLLLNMVTMPRYNAD